jgi:hypothetical protein
MSGYSRTASFEKVKEDWEAVKYHALKFELGYRYSLAVLCYQYYQLEKNSHASDD